MKLPRGSRSPLIAESGDQKDTFNRGRQVSDNGMRRDLGLLTIQKVFVSLGVNYVVTMTRQSLLLGLYG